MMKNEKTRPTAATVGQAQSGKMVSSFQNDFTPLATEKQSPIFDILPIGRERAISSEALAAVTGCKSVRELQKRIERERLAGAVILSDTHGGGYYRSNDPAELRRFVRTLNARARNRHLCRKGATQIDTPMHFRLFYWLFLDIFGYSKTMSDIPHLCGMRAI